MNESYLTENEKIIKEEIENKLNIVPYLVVYEITKYNSVLSVLFWNEDDKKEFHDKIKLHKYCDLSNIIDGPLSITLYDNEVENILRCINKYDL